MIFNYKKKISKLLRDSDNDEVATLFEQETKNLEDKVKQDRYKNFIFSAFFWVLATLSLVNIEDIERLLYG